MGTKDWSHCSRCSAPAFCLSLRVFLRDWQKIRLVLADNQNRLSPRSSASTDHEDDLARLFGNDHGLDSYATKAPLRCAGCGVLQSEAYIGIYQTLSA